MAGREEESWHPTEPRPAPADAAPGLQCGTLQSLGSGGSPDAIEVLVPDGTAGISAVHRTAAGHVRRAFVRAPLVLVVPAGEACSMHGVCPGDTLVLRLAAQYYTQRVRAALGEAIPLAARFGVPDPFIRAITGGLLQQLHDGDLPGTAYLEPLGAVLSVHLARHYGTASAPSASTPYGLPPHRLRQVQAFVREHLSEVLHVERLAAEAHMSQYHFARMFKHATGQSPHLYVLTQRVGHAKALLQGTDLRLLEIAEQSGFRTQAHFTAVFSRYTSMTPRLFRLASRRVVSPVATA